MDPKVDYAVLPLSDGATLDDIEDLPGFATFPTGAYRIILAEGLTKKEIGKHPAAEMKMTLLETIEITDDKVDNTTDGVPTPKVGDICSTAYMLDNKVGQDALKQVLVPLSARLGTRVVSELYLQSKGLELLVIGKRTYDKEKDRHYFNIKKVEVL